MDYLPLFANLKNKPVLVVGGGRVATRKIELLNRAGAHIQIVAQELCEELIAIHKKNKCEWISTTYQSQQLKRVFLVIAATNNSKLNQRIYKDASSRYLLVNTVDEPQHCSCIFPAIIDRSPIIIGISSSGTAPVLARLLREKIEALLPAHLGLMAKIAGEWRDKVKERFFSLSERRNFWHKAFNGVFSNQVARGQLNEAKLTLDQQINDDINISSGEIFLVGAGPGNSDLLTLRALQVMQIADVLLYDSLVSEEVLDLSRRDADRICVGKRANSHSTTQEEINFMLIKLAKQGKRVVRLKGGDPFIFGRGGEELQAAKSAGIPFQVVPGITTALGVSAYTGIPLTHRDYSQGVLFITGHYRAHDSITDWPNLTQSNQTLVIYMGSITAGAIASKLIINGRDLQTPVAIISRGTYPDQKVLIGTLNELEILTHKIPTPILLIIGEVVNLHHQLSWFKNTENEP
ncbi:siroheme synthase CysG [Candidatus Erwinia haradaeae]|uniref:Siroheme synthase n=1 Tax=Candidatus Erwinia haradaeae TaxID=1922217 RepID=A0A451D8U2_9GAMM|nr:siroheme synthase CysG [Candidatus Erwinia haradaeae]VFP82237.1 Siroheme synthase [Candidatus Erwinia haradaeae]